MKIGILTHYDVSNQGAQLQMYATFNKLKELGHQPVVLTYNKNYDFEPEARLKNQVSIKSMPYYIKNYLIDKGLGLTLHNAKKYSIHNKFREENFIFSSYSSADIDMAIVGSDEVLSLESGVNIMMYGHGVNTNNLITYAPSFGQTDLNRINEFHCENLISSGLSQFKALAARDENTSEMIETLTGKKSTIVCDPVLLYDFSKTVSNVKLPPKKYIIVYAYDRNMIDTNEVKSIKDYAKLNNLITVSAGTYHSWCDINVACDSLEWIEFFRGAEAVVTDTYHGTIVAAITNTPMAIFVRSKINSKKLTDLIIRLGLEDRQITEFSGEQLNTIFKRKLDTNKLNNIILKIRKESEEYLLESIEKCKTAQKR